MEQWYGLTQEEVLKRLSTNRTGLSEEEAEKRLEVYGENILKEQEEMPWWQIFLGQFKDLLVMILIGAAGVSMVTGDPESALVIFSVLLLNAILGTVHTRKPRRSLESLKRLASTDTLSIGKGGSVWYLLPRWFQEISWFWKQEGWYQQTAASYSPTALPAMKALLQEKL